MTGARLPLAWQWLVAEVNGRVLDGTPGVRDALAPCEEYEPLYPTLAGIRWLTPRHEGEVGRCNTDGHYLCVECPHISHRALVERGFFPDPDEARP